jgi:hypothetical protein
MSAPKVFLRRFILRWRSAVQSARAGAQRRARGQRTRAHAEARAKRRRHVAQGIPAARAAAFVAERPGRVGAQPVASCFALRINALHGEARQILHIVFPQRPQRLLQRRPVANPSSPRMDGCWRGLWRKPAVVSRKKTTIYWGTLAPGPRVVDDRHDQGGRCARSQERGHVSSQAWCARDRAESACYRRQLWRTLREVVGTSEVRCRPCPIFGWRAHAFCRLGSWL